MAATASEAIMIELEKEGWEWIKSERFHKQEKLRQEKKEKNNPMKVCVLKYDHFENIHRLDVKLPTYEGAPNFRQVPGYLVFGTGQPTKEGFKNALEAMFNVEGVKTVLWTNMRQEPVVYLNGQSFTPRLPDRMNENMEFPGVSGEDIEMFQEQFVQAIKDAVEVKRQDRYTPDEEKGINPKKKGVAFKTTPQVKYYRDTYAEHPEDRENIEYNVHLDNDEDLTTLSGIYFQLQDLGFALAYSRLPIVDEKAPSEADFDRFVENYRQQDPKTAFIFNCQMGKGRTTTGMILACLMKDIVHGQDGGRQYQELVVDRNEIPDPEEAEEEDHRLGNFKVISALYNYIPEARAAKAHLDHIIDLCGEPKQGGTGLQNLRECITWSEDKFNFEPKIKKPFWKQMGKNFIERYCFLIIFATYLKERASRDFDITFILWLDIRAEIREIITNGTKNFAWL